MPKNFATNQPPLLSPQKPSLERYQYKKHFLVFLNSDPFAERDYDCVRENATSMKF
jgi:hypothetical protein